MFQQDGHTTLANLALLQETFPGREIARRGSIYCPPRSCDMTAVNFFCEPTMFMQINIQILWT